MKRKHTVLTCKFVIFYSRKDEDAFFEWIKKIGCIESFDGAGDELYLHTIKSRATSYVHLDELIGLFYRYRIDMKQLKQFLTKRNKKWFYDDKQKYWHKYIFGNKKFKTPKHPPFN